MPHPIRSAIHVQTAFFIGAFALGFAATVAACSGATTPAADSTVDPQGSPTTPLPSSGPGSAHCQSCVQDSDCASGNVCAQFSSDSFCAKTCAKTADCSADTTCSAVTGTDGKSTNACIPNADACGAPGSSGGSGSGGGSSGSSGNPGVAVDAGGPVVGTVGATGGSVSRLLFAVVGDTRPPVINDTSGYPKAVINKIYSDLEALSPRPAFAVATGDYVFSTGNGTQAAPQFDMYVAARSKFSNVLFPALGNHECTGAVTSNCGSGNKDGLTNNYSEFLAKLLAPVGQTNPNYVIHVDSTDKTWTSKLVFVAGNAWSPADATWLENTLATPTTYTFIIRHEPRAASNAPGCKASEAIMANHPYTLAIVGHTHTYGKTGARQVTIGNGGAPLTGGANFGFGLIQQRADGAIQVDMIDYSTGKADGAFRFALRADGSPAP